MKLKIILFRISVVILGLIFITTTFKCCPTKSYINEFSPAVYARYDIDSLYIDTIKLKRNDSIIEKQLNIPYGNPIKRKIYINSPYGYRIHPISKQRKFHNGLDIKSNSYDPVYSTADGIIDQILYDHNGYGNYIVINHLNGYRTLYAHLIPKLTVSKSKPVKSGDLIGYTGRSGSATNYHLHYTIFKNHKTVNPQDYIK